MNYNNFAFDAYGTLLDVHSAVAKHAKAIGEKAPALSMLWRTKQLEYTWVRSLAKQYKDFNALTIEALDFALAFYNIENKNIRTDLLKAYETLSAYEEVAPVLQTLKQQGNRIAVFSNGTMAMLETALKAAKIESLIDDIVSVDELQIYKTAPETYEALAKKLNCKPQEISFQSSNRWDIAGGKAAGLHCVWVNRTNAHNEYSDLSPDITCKDLRILLDG